MTPPELPYPNGMASRITDLEIAQAVTKEQIAVLRDDIRALKHGAYAACVLLIAVLGVLIPLLTRK